MQQIRTRGVVLWQQPQAERDRIYLLYTERLGKLLARGFAVTKVERLMAGHLLPFVLIDLQLQERQGRWSIVDARALQPREQMTVERMARMQVIVQLVEVQLEPEAADQALWQVLTGCTERLFGPTYPLTFLSSLVAVLQVLGLMPSVSHCVITGEKMQPAEAGWWSSLAGGLVSEAALSRAPGAIPLRSAESLKLLIVLIGQPEIANRLRAPLEAIAEAEQLLLSYIELLIQKNVKALPFIHITSQ